MVLSIDPSTKNTGIAIFDEDKLIATDHISCKGKNTITRIIQVRDGVKKIIESYDITEVVIEDVPPTKFRHTVKVLHYLQGALLILLHDYDLPYTLILPNAWRKQLYFRHKGADLKEQSLYYCNGNYKIGTTDTDIADAVCIGSAYVRGKKIQQEQQKQ